MSPSHPPSSRGARRDRRRRHPGELVDRPGARGRATSACSAAARSRRRRRSGPSSATEAVVGGERTGVVVEGFDVGASPREFALGPAAPTLILSTTNGTSTILTAAARCETVLIGSLLNLSALVDAAASAAGDDVVVFCAGFKGGFALDDAYCAGRIVAALPGRAHRRGSRRRAARRRRSRARGGVRRPHVRPAGLEADIAFCTQEDLLDTVPRFERMVGPAAEIVA